MPKESDFFHGLLGQTGGTQTVTLLETEMPAHSHSMMSGPTLVSADSDICTGNSMGKSSQGNVYGSFNAQNLTPLSLNALASAGGSLPHNNMQPYLTLSFCIAMQGVFPPRT